MHFKWVNCIVCEIYPNKAKKKKRREGKTGRKLERRGGGGEGVLFYFFFLTALCGVWDLSSPTRDQTYVPCSGSLES